MSILKKQLRRGGRQAQFDGVQACSFVNPKALMALCETPFRRLVDESHVWPAPMALFHRPGGRIYVHAKALRHFQRYALPLIRGPFVLVTGDGDTALSPNDIGGDVVKSIADHPKLICWFAQNLGYEHPKIRPMPIGLDYHTMAMRRELSWGANASPRAQEEMLLAVRALGQPLADRMPTGYSNWHFKSDRGGRAEAKEAIHPDSAFYEPEHLTRWQSWVRNTGYFFTLSPPGVGLDCHRTWEALLLGSVPIVAETSINILFENLPVVVAKQWSDITPAFLKQEKTRILDSEFDFAPLFMSYWHARFHGETAPKMQMRFQEFMAIRGA